MAKGFDYSKWDRLEISDDEETFHPNLDNGLNTRVNRITRDRKEEEIDTEKAEAIAKGDKAKADKLESKRPLHVGNLCHVTDERTIIQSGDGSRKDTTKKGEQFSVDEYSLFKSDNQKILDQFTNADWEDSAQLLKDHGNILMSEYANSYYMLTALDEEMKGNRKGMEKLCKQGQIVSQIHQLAEPMKRHPRDLIPRFFEKFEQENSRAAFQEGVDHFMKQLQKRAVDKKKEQEEEARQQAEEEAAAKEEQQYEKVSLVEAMYTMEKEERLKMGQGKLDPLEIFESLPENLQECFRSGDIEELKKVASEMPQEEFSAHFQRCCDSGLWSKGS